MISFKKWQKMLLFVLIFNFKRLSEVIYSYRLVIRMTKITIRTNDSS